MILHLSTVARTKAEDRVDYRYEDYAETGDRIHVTTQGVYFDVGLSAAVALKGNFVYDSISGATPLGPPYLPGTNAVNTAQMSDQRYAGFLEPVIKWGNQTIMPQVSYSQEDDYQSLGIALNDAIDFNEKNTTVTIGASHSFDYVLPNEGEYYYGTEGPLTQKLKKDSTEGLIGVTQLLGPNTVATADITVGYASGYLSDPYKRVLFDNVPYNPGPDPANPYPYTVWPERRPEEKLREVGFIGFQHYFDGVNGAMDLSYRFTHDSWDVFSSTVALQWNQKIGKYVILSPMFRYYIQSAAWFYATHFPGDPDNATTYPLPSAYSSDYRLSSMETFTGGITLSVRVQEHLSLDLQYQRYEMFGRDGVTQPVMYPKANVITGGFTVWF
ncbi:MAG: DUF3570 domain-containing protein [Verrucomicrobiota bacterium]